MFAMWRDGTEYRFGTKKSVPDEVELSGEVALVAA